MHLTDRLIREADHALRTLFATPVASRTVSTAQVAGGENIPGPAKDESIRLMRVNHCGEVCAQALYQGQAFVARDPETRASLERAAGEERDHLAWCAARVRELGG
ncbi:MAG: demethoxyubiquinone hydroxylase family protein, partial [Betaproteobacteria bacterium]|nr:demethoxyubiquinone hydroxylase family protein [Betaproteobacteria bacterium]